MNTLLRSPYIRVLCCYLAMSIAGLIPIPERAWAAFIYLQSENTTELDPESREVLQTTLENDLIAEKLSELGLSLEEITQRIDQLSPEERRIVLENLQTVQVGGQFEILFILLFPIFILGVLLQGVSLITTGELTYESSKKPLTFLKETELDFPPYKGEVRVFEDEEPEEDSILVGYVRVWEKGTKDELLDKIKKSVAKHGADTIVLSTSEPKLNYPDGYLIWGATAYRTKGIEDTK